MELPILLPYHHHLLSSTLRRVKKRNATVYSHNAGQLVYAAVTNRMFLLSNTPSKVVEVVPTAEGAHLITTTVGATSKVIRGF